MTVVLGDVRGAVVCLVLKSSFWGDESVWIQITFHGLVCVTHYGPQLDLFGVSAGVRFMGVHPQHLLKNGVSFLVNIHGPCTNFLHSLFDSTPLSV